MLERTRRALRRLLAARPPAAGPEADARRGAVNPDYALDQLRRALEAGESLDPVARAGAGRRVAA
jgi:hypothetical protein